MTLPVPTELLRSILNDVGSLQDLLTLRTTSRTLHALVTPCVFGSLNVRDTPESSSAFLNLVQSENVRPYVKTVTFRDSNLQDSEDGTELEHDSESDPPYSGNKEVREKLVAAFSQLGSLPSLDTLHLHFNREWNEDTWIGLIVSSDALVFQLEVFQALASISDALSPRLRTLSITSLIASPRDTLTSPSFLALFYHLECLRLCVLSDRDSEAGVFEWPIQGFWGSTIPTLLQATARNGTLRELTLWSDQPISCAPKPIFPPGLAYPALRSLSVRFVLLNALTGIEDFVTRHGGSLRRLSLDRCKVAMSSHTIGLSWAQMWHRWATALTALTDLGLQFEQPMAGPNKGRQLAYACGSHEHGWVGVNLGAPEDPRALEAFRADVEARKRAREE